MFPIDHPLPAIRFSGDGKKPYRLLIKTSTRFIAVKNINGEVNVLSTDGNVPLTIPPSKDIAIWPCLPLDVNDSKSSVSPKGEILEFDCAGNEINELSISGEMALQSLNCSGNLLQHLNLVGTPGLGGCVDIRTLDCSNNQLTELDLSELATLRTVNCSFNKLQSLRLGSKLKKLQNIDCSSNCLPLLDLAGLVALQLLNATNNLSMGKC